MVMESVVKQPQFSIISGTHKHAKTIPKFIESCIEQTNQDFELHLCNNGIRDETIETARNLVDQSILKGRVFYHRQINLGMRLSRSINKGIAKAKGKYCVFVMGDSFMEKDYLETLAAWAKPTRILCGIRTQVDEGRAVDIEWRLKRGAIPNANVLLLNDCWNMITGNGLCIPTWALRKFGGWNEKIKGWGGDDNELVARLFFKGLTVWSIPDAQIYHHYHKEQVVNKKNNALLRKLIGSYAA